MSKRSKRSKQEQAGALARELGQDPWALMDKDRFFFKQGGCMAGLLKCPLAALFGNRLVAQPLCLSLFELLSKML